MEERTRLNKLCLHGLEKKGINDKAHRDRLIKEIRAIDQQAEHEYLLSLHDKFKNEKLKFPINENNSLVDYLLELTDHFDINKENVYVQGEFPDIDIDYLRDVRDYVKRVWAPSVWGQEYICEIGTYGTSGIKGSILDMARVHNMGKDEIQAITVKMEDKDDEGLDLEWDKALEMYPEFKSYCERYPQVAESARLLLDRNRTGGVHAGGLIISSVPINGFVPLEVRSIKKENREGIICSAWTEGLKSQDLSAVGLIKFDLLVVNNLMQIAQACNLVKKRHGLSSICALPGSWDWSDTSYLNDKKSIETADNADLQCIFQFDGDGIRKLVKRGGVISFDDLAAYSALYRPGPLNMGMDARYCKRKNWSKDKNHIDGEPYNIHPLMKPILEKTYGVLVYQEQVMDILRTVGNIPDMHTEKVRKAISKKKVKEFIKYKKMFIDNGQKNLSANKDFVEDLWNQIESFAEYGFNKSVTSTTLIPTMVCGKIVDKKIKDFVKGDIVLSVNEYGQTVETEVVALHDHGELEGFEVTFDDGYQVTCSANHKFLTENGQVSLREICRTGSYILCDHNIRSLYVTKENRRVEKSVQSGFSKQNRVKQTSDKLRSMQGSKVATKTREIEIFCKMRREDVNTRENVGTSQDLPEVSSIGMEKRRYSTFIKMWNGVSNLQRKRRTFEKLSSVRFDQNKEYSGQNGEVESRQFSSISQENLFRYSTKDINSARIISDKICQSKEMARGKSREICQMHRSSLEKSEAIKNGKLVERTIEMGQRESSLWGRSQTSGLCERQDLDRSGRILSLLRAQKQFGESVQASQGSVQRPDAQRGMHKKGEHNASEIEHGVFSFFDGSDEGGDLGLGAGHAPITNTGNLVHRKVVRVRSVGKCHMFDLEVANPTHNFILPNGIVTSNSHAYAYTYISSRLLWLKTHYPLEFYAAILMCEEKNEKFKQVRIDAKSHGIEICPVNINKSKENFHIEDGKIFFGFSNIKGIGKDIATKIVQGQPYKDFSDFLDRFGTDANVLKPLIALGVFDEPYDRLTLRKFSEFYKDKASKRKQSQARQKETGVKKLKELRDKLLTQVSEDDPDFEKMCEFTQEAKDIWDSKFSDVMIDVPYKYRGEQRIRKVSFADILADLLNKREISTSKFDAKQSVQENNPISIDKFDKTKIVIDEVEENILKNERSLNDEISYPEAEKLYYGFEWVHELETCPKYTGMTFDRFLSGVKENEAWYVEVRVEDVRKRISKNNVEFYSVDIEDADGKRMVVNVWKDDMLRWRDEIKQGALLKMRVRPPSGGFNTLTFHSVPRHEKAKKWPTKEEDWRIEVLQPQTPKKVEVVFDDFGLTDIPGWEEV